jgi:hypothetical protein
MHFVTPSAREPPQRAHRLTGKDQPPIIAPHPRRLLHQSANQSIIRSEETVLPLLVLPGLMTYHSTKEGNEDLKRTGNVLLVKANNNQQVVG